MFCVSRIRTQPLVCWNWNSPTKVNPVLSGSAETSSEGPVPAAKSNTVVAWPSTVAVLKPLALPGGFTNDGATPTLLPRFPWNRKSANTAAFAVYPEARTSRGGRRSWGLMGIKGVPMEDCRGMISRNGPVCEVLSSGSLIDIRTMTIDKMRSSIRLRETFPRTARCSGYGPSPTFSGRRLPRRCQGCPASGQGVASAEPFAAEQWKHRVTPERWRWWCFAHGLPMPRGLSRSMLAVSGGRPEIVKKITKPACRPETVIPISAHRREFPSALLFL